MPIFSDGDPRLVQLQSPNPMIALLLELGTDPVQRFTDSGSPITIEASGVRRTFESSRELVSAGAPGSQGERDSFRDAYTVVFGGIKEEFTGGRHTGIPLRVWVTIDDGTRSGNWLAPIVLYTGACGGAEVLGEGIDEVYTQATFVGELAQLDGTRQVILTEDAQKNRSPGDNALDHITVVDDIGWTPQ